jgi:hypothetical protein
MCRGTSKLTAANWASIQKQLAHEILDIAALVGPDIDRAIDSAEKQLMITDGNRKRSPVSGESRNV